MLLRRLIGVVTGADHERFRPIWTSIVRAVIRCPALRHIRIEGNPRHRRWRLSVPKKIETITAVLVLNTATDYCKDMRPVLEILGAPNRVPLLLSLHCSACKISPYFAEMSVFGRCSPQEISLQTRYWICRSFCRLCCGKTSAALIVSSSADRFQTHPIKAHRRRPRPMQTRSLWPLLSLRPIVPSRSFAFLVGCLFRFAAHLACCLGTCSAMSRPKF